MDCFQRHCNQLSISTSELTLPISKVTTEQAFSAMNIVKIRLCKKLEDDFLTNYLVIYTEEEIAENFSTKCL
jgi:hypothetical protein